jgi:cyclopropane-fatty-acyl-phospholipid synthase
MNLPLGLLHPNPPAIASVSRWLYAQVSELIAPSGATLDGNRPWDPQIRRPRALSRLLFNGTLGAGEAYVDGDWDCEALAEFTARLLTGDVVGRFGRLSLGVKVNELTARLPNGQTEARTKADIISHYDRGDDLYSAMLGPTMTYSCGYWQRAATLEAAQDAKHALVCHKLKLEPGLRVLDIGCWWGGFAKFAAQRHGVSVVGVTVSPSQARAARARCADLPVEIREHDYRDITGQYDRVVSIGMFEHVGPANYRTFFEVAASALDPCGLFLLHTIGNSTSQQTADPWIARYIFPGSVLPSAAQITRACEGLFVLEDWHNFGPDYDRTLVAWHERFERAWPQLAARYSDRFRRLWRYYLLTCAGTFRARQNHLWQLVLSPRGLTGGYRRVSE